MPAKTSNDIWNRKFIAPPGSLEPNKDSNRLYRMSTDESALGAVGGSDWRELVSLTYRIGDLEI